MKYMLTTVLLCVSLITLTAQTTNLATELDKIYSSKYPSDSAGCAVLIAHKGNVIYRKAFSRSPVPWQMYFRDEKNFGRPEVFPNNHLFTWDGSGKVDAFMIQSGGQELKIKKMN